MDTTIRNIDDEAYQRLRAYAAYHGLTLGAAFSQLVMRHIDLPAGNRRRSFFDYEPFSLGSGSEPMSEDIDQVVYGIEPDDS